jgi:hypothetical protein
MLRWLAAFAFTQYVEVPLWAEALEKYGANKRGFGARAAIGFGASALTHPVVWFVFPRIVPFGYWPMVGAAETFAVVAEALYMKAFGLRRARDSSIASGRRRSSRLGFLCRWLFGWP